MHNFCSHQDAQFRKNSNKRIIFFDVAFGIGSIGPEVYAIENGVGFASIDDLIKAAPLSTAHTKQDAVKFVRKAFPIPGQEVIDYPELNLVASSIHSVAEYTLNEAGVKKYIAHPQIQLMMCRYNFNS